jgi:hypothetical protein
VDDPQPQIELHENTRRPTCRVKGTQFLILARCNYLAQTVNTLSRPCRNSIKASVRRGLRQTTREGVGLCTEPSSRWLSTAGPTLRFASAGGAC